MHFIKFISPNCISYTAIWPVKGAVLTVAFVERCPLYHINQTVANFNRYKVERQEINKSVGVLSARMLWLDSLDKQELYLKDLFEKP